MRDNALRTREARIRAAAARQGLTLAKSRQRDPRGLLHGTYMLTNPGAGTVEASGSPDGYGLSLDDVEAALR